MEQDFYQNKIKKITKLIKSQKYQEALRLVQEEMAMPYIPLKYEQQFKNFETYLNPLIKPTTTSYTLTAEQIVKKLYGSEMEQGIAIQHLSHCNLRSIKREIQQRLQTWDDGYKKAVVFQLLAEQQVNIDISFGQKTFNPANFSILDQKEVHKGLETLHKLAFKMPHIAKTTIGEFQRYALMIFPHQIVDGQSLALSIHNIILHMIGELSSLNPTEQKI